jgi:hypothetical protein
LCSADFFKFSAPASVKFQCKKLAIFDSFVMAKICVASQQEHFESQVG